jgi:glycerophosphoryl diester phosphodiesterase
VSLAQQQGLLVHPSPFRCDELPAGIDDFNDLLEIFVQQAGVNGLFTDFPDRVSHYLRQNTKPS